MFFFYFHLTIKIVVKNIFSNILFSNIGKSSDFSSSRIEQGRKWKTFPKTNKLNPQYQMCGRLIFQERVSNVQGTKCFLKSRNVLWILCSLIDRSLLFFKQNAYCLMEAFYFLCSIFTFYGALLLFYATYKCFKEHWSITLTYLWNIYILSWGLFIFCTTFFIPLEIIFQFNETIWLLLINHMFLNNTFTCLMKHYWDVKEYGSNQCFLWNAHAFSWVLWNISVYSTFYIQCETLI